MPSFGDQLARTLRRLKMPPAAPPPQQRPPRRRPQRVTINATVWGDQPPLSMAVVQASGGRLRGSGFDNQPGLQALAAVPATAAAARGSAGDAPPPRDQSAAANSDVINGSPRRCPQRRRRVRSDHIAKPGSTRAMACQAPASPRRCCQGSWSSSRSSSMRSLLASAGGAVSGASPHLPGPGPCCDGLRTCFGPQPRSMPSRAP